MKAASNEKQARKFTEETQKEIAEMFSSLLADVHQLYVKTLGYHWNVEDSRFIQLHEFFESQYKQLADFQDDIAERIRMIGERSPCKLSQLVEMKRLPDTEDVEQAQKMIHNLLSDYEALILWMRADIERLQRIGDPGGADMLTQILRQFEKNAWFLRSHL